MIGKKAVMVKYTKRKVASGDMLQYFADHPEKLREKRLRDAKKKHAMVSFADELEKVAISGRTVWKAKGLRIAKKLETPGQVRDIAERLVNRERPIYHSWPLRNIPPDVLSKRASYVALADELEKVAASTSFMQNVGNKVTSWGKSLASTPVRTAQAVGDIVKSPAGALKHGWNETWGPKVGFGGKALFVGGTALQAADLTRDSDITGRDESRVTRGLRFAGGTLAGTMGMTRGILPSIALGISGDVAGGYAGRAIDKLRGRKAKPKSGTTQNTPMKPALAQQALQG